MRVRVIDVNGEWASTRHNAIGAQESPQRRIVIPRIVEQQAGARSFALVGVIVFGAGDAARTDCAPRVEGLQRAGHAGGVGGQAHRAEMIAVDVGESVGGGGLGAEGHAVIRDRGHIRAIFQVADIARRDARAAASAGFLDAGVAAVVLVGFGGYAAGDLDGLIFGVPGVGAPAASQYVAVRIIGVGLPYCTVYKVEQHFLDFASTFSLSQSF